MRYEAASAADYKAKGYPWPWHNFTPAELACKGTGRLEIETTSMDRLQKLRTLFGRPMRINSGYRSPEHNAAVSGTGRTGPHTVHGYDVGIYGPPALELITLAVSVGFTGIGIQQKGSHASRFVHLDDIAPGHPNNPRPALWSY